MAKVLIVEPDRVLAKIYTAALERDGHEVVWRHGAQEAISAADEQCPDIVILELRLANHNGAEFLYEFCSYPEWQGTPVIIASSVHPRQEGVSAITSQMSCVVEHFYKPAMSLHQLVNSVRWHVSESQTDAELPVGEIGQTADVV